MRISTSVRYGVRIILEIAQCSDQNAVGRQVIADHQQVSPEYIAQIARKLTRAGLLETTKGPGGGYRLGKATDQIRLGEIFRAIEGPIALAPCLSDDEACDRLQNCATHQVWLKLSQLMDQYLQSISIADLMNFTGQLDGSCAPGCKIALDVLQNSLDSFAINHDGCTFINK